jgi:hypothetical protein
MKPAHLRTQSALVRMIYDPAFAAAVKAAPRSVLPHLPPALADELGAFDLRALRRDRDRRERTLSQLCDELPASTMLAHTDLLRFYASAQFHEAIEEGHALVFALAAFLESQLAEGALQPPTLAAVLAAVLAIELASARARRDTGAATPRHAGKLRRAAGVEPVEVPAGALSVLQAAREQRPLPSLAAGRETLCAIALAGDVSVVQIERPLYAVLISAVSPRTRVAIVAEAALRLDGDHAAAEAAVESLLEDELLVTEP